MGNRAVMVFADEDGLINDLSPCIYLHLNGGKDSIAPLLSVSKSLGYFNNRHPGASRNHVAALGGQWLKDGEPLDTGIFREYSGWELDNGIYVVDSNGDISKRINAPSAEELDYASRMARAKEQGFDVSTVWYHGTPNGDIEGYEEKMLNNSDEAEHQTQQTQDDDFSPGM